MPAAVSWNVASASACVGESMTWSRNEKRASWVSEGNDIRQHSYLPLLSQIKAIRDARRTKPDHVETGVKVT